jgi:hypothetical protein
MPLETLAFLAVSLYATGIGSYFWLKRRSLDSSRSYDRVPEPDDLTTLELLARIESVSDDEFLAFLSEL